MFDKDMFDYIEFDISDCHVVLSRADRYSEQLDEGSFIYHEGDFVALDLFFNGKDHVYRMVLNAKNLQWFLFAISKGEDEFRKVSEELEDYDWDKKINEQLEHEKRWREWKEKHK